MYLCGGRYIEGKQNTSETSKTHQEVGVCGILSTKWKDNVTLQTKCGGGRISTYWICFQGHVMIFGPERLGIFYFNFQFSGHISGCKKHMPHMPAAILFHECHVSRQPLQVLNIQTGHWHLHCMILTNLIQNQGNKTLNWLGKTSQSLTDFYFPTEKSC